MLKASWQHRASPVVLTLVVCYPTIWKNAWAGGLCRGMGLVTFWDVWQAMSVTLWQNFEPIWPIGHARARLEARFTRSYPTAVDILYRASHGSLLHFTHGRPCGAQYSISTAVRYLHVKRGFKSISRVTYGSNWFEILPKCDRHLKRSQASSHDTNLQLTRFSRLSDNQLVLAALHMAVGLLARTVPAICGCCCALNLGEGSHIPVIWLHS